MIKAIQEDDDDTMLKMFNHGAKAEAFLDKKKKQKPLHFIAMNGSVRSLLILMGKGLEELSPQDHEGDTPLNMAIRNNKTVIAKSLIELGAEIETKDASMRTPLMNACLYGNLEIVKVLLEAGANWKATNAINDT
jgi:ankyrin repeat protein